MAKAAKKTHGPSPQYLRGFRHGLQYAAIMAYDHNGGRSWSAGEISSAIAELGTAARSTAILARKLINKRTDNIPCGRP